MICIKLRGPIIHRADTELSCRLTKCSAKSQATPTWTVKKSSFRTAPQRYLPSRSVKAVMPHVPSPIVAASHFHPWLPRSTRPYPWAITASAITKKNGPVQKQCRRLHRRAFQRQAVPIQINAATQTQVLTGCGTPITRSIAAMGNPQPISTPGSVDKKSDLSLEAMVSPRAAAEFRNILVEGLCRQFQPFNCGQVREDRFA